MRDGDLKGLAYVGIPQVSLDDHDGVQPVRLNAQQPSSSCARL